MSKLKNSSKLPDLVRNPWRSTASWSRWCCCSPTLWSSEREIETSDGSGCATPQEVHGSFRCLPLFFGGYLGRSSTVFSTCYRCPSPFYGRNAMRRIGKAPFFLKMEEPRGWLFGRNRERFTLWPQADVDMDMNWYGGISPRLKVPISATTFGGSTAELGVFPRYSLLLRWLPVTWPRSFWLCLARAQSSQRGDERCRRTESTRRCPTAMSPRGCWA